ncbi:MAG: aspartyl protease family protein [Bacteroidota bacterium]
MKKIFLSSAIILFLCSCNIIKVVRLMNKGEVNSKEFCEQVPIEFENRMVIVPVTIDGVIYKFILDTGAPTVLSKEIADKMNLKNISKVASADASENKSSMSFTKVGDIFIDSLKFINQGAAVYDFSLNKELSCFTFNSIVGANLMKDAIWQIDIQNKIIRITNDINKLRIPETAMKFKFRQQITDTPIADITINNFEVKNIVLDYGSGSGIDLVSEKLVKKIHADKIKFVRIFGYNSMGLYGGKNDTTYVFESDVTLDENFIGTQKISLRRNGLSTIGTQILKNYIVTFDWPESIVYMEKIATDTTDENKTFGFTALLSDGKFLVTSITEKSSADEKGLSLGDQIISVNNKDYTNFSSEDYCDYIINGMVPKDVNDVEITFKHNDVLQKVKLERRKLAY